MAILWYKNTSDGRYEVRSAGNSIRLYTDGIFHSQWNPKRPLSGHVWDLLFLPMCFHRVYPQLNSALILGLGGGAVVNAIQRFIQVNEIAAVDLDENHIQIARQFFKVDSGAAKLNFVCQDAKQYLRGCQRKFDVIVEDLFISQSEQVNNAVRAIPADDVWLKQLSRCVKKQGILIMNFESSAQLQKSLTRRVLKQTGFVSLWEFSLPRYENAIAVLSKTPLDKARFESNLTPFRQYVSRHGNYLFAMKQRL